MGLSRSKRVVLLGVALLVVGLTGRAAANTATPAAGRKMSAVSGATATATPSASATTAAVPPRTAPPKAAVKAPAKAPVKAPAKAPVRAIPVKHATGPANSRLTTGSKAVALTFDDGPDPATTPQLLRMLAQQHIHATFCLVGENVQRHPELVRQIVAGGHTLCNHTWNHDLRLGRKPAAKIKSDLQRTNAAIHRAAPTAKIKYFRSPGGNFTPTVVSVARQLGMASIYWKIDPRDWEHRKGESHAAHRARVINYIKHHCRNGAIVLSHDYAQPDTIAAYRTLLPYLKHHFQLIALP
jgi:peptidoglycan-N-acetylglucosamine deacetylase